MLISWSEMRIIVTLVVGLENIWQCPAVQTVLVPRWDTCSWVCPSVPVSLTVSPLTRVTTPWPRSLRDRGEALVLYSVGVGESGVREETRQGHWIFPDQIPAKGIQCLVSCSGGVHPSPAQWGPLDELIKELLIETLTTGMIITLTGHTWHLTRRR